MRILYVVDGRSPIALNWMRYFCEGAHEVHLISTFPCEPDLKLASFHVLSVAFSDLREQGIRDKGIGVKGLVRRAVPVGVRTGFRQWFGPLTLPRAARELHELVGEIQPNLVHAMRIPYEGMLAAMAMSRWDPDGHDKGGHAGPPQTGGHIGQPRQGGYTGSHSMGGHAGPPRQSGYTGSHSMGGHAGPPLLVSVWGNDFTLHARATPLMARLTRRTLRGADALHTDCRRDLRLAHDWGYAGNKPAMVLPGGGGVQLDLFYPPDTLAKVSKPSQGSSMVINPRGFRAYVCNEAFFQAIPLVLKEIPTVRFICPAMAGEREAQGWVEALGIGGAVELLPQQTRLQMAELFRRCQVAVSPSTHDGTPNTLLEAMACGCFPIAGDIESLREWIDPGENGLLVDPRDARSLAEAILQALSDANLRLSAREHNTRLVAERAEYRQVMGEAENFYFRLLNR